MVVKPSRSWPLVAVAVALLGILAFAAAPVEKGGEDSSEGRGRRRGQKPLSEAALWLQGYLEIDTTNPPGNEAAAASYLGEILHREGISTQILVTPQGRGNLYARLEGSGPATHGALLLLHHMDVVAPGEGWSLEPFSGLVRAGRLWGRGAIDAKSLGISQLAAFLDLKRRRVPLARDVIFLAVADEEKGGGQGMGWLLEHHPELFAGVEAVLNEGGSNKVIGERLLWWGLEVAQKRPLWLRVTARGRAGHGSGLNPHSAAHQLLNGLARVLDRPPTYRVTPAAQLYFGAIAPLHGEPFRSVFDGGGLEAAQVSFDGLVEDGELHRLLLPGMPTFFMDTVQVTSLQAGDSVVNVVPGEASALVDIRLLPDTDTEAFLQEIQERLGPRVDVEVLLSSPPLSPSPLDTPIYRQIEAVLSSSAPVVPAFITGTTDSRYFRQRGIAAYGFAPFTLNGDESAGIHGPDESIPLEKFDRGVETMRRVVLASVSQ